MRGEHEDFRQLLREAQEAAGRVSGLLPLVD
jgi:hypothetical protein